MSAPRPLNILTLNAGSSSLKAGWFEVAGKERLRIAIEITGIGGDGELVARDGDGRILEERRHRAGGHGDAFEHVLDWLRDREPDREISAVGHRIVHGGPDHRSPERATEELVEQLRRFVPFAPDHLPREIRGLEAVWRRSPGLPQVVCYDTAFHRDLPESARVLPLPRELERAGCIRYGFHGLSYEYIVWALEHRGATPGDLIIAHLGSGASMAAVRDGRSLDTTMGFTPLGGLVMSTRTGDLDPGVLIFLLRERSISVDELNALLNKDSGLAGIGGRGGDMKALLDAAGDDPAADLAVDVFCREARKHLAAMAAALGGLDTLVFTGGIGENAPEVRARICDGLGFVGIDLDPSRNAENTDVISTDRSRVTVRVMDTDEEAMVVRHTASVLRATS